MKKYNSSSLLFLFSVVLLMSCGGGNESASDAKQLRAQIEQVKKEKATLDAT
jgi:cell division protein FtsB